MNSKEIRKLADEAWERGNRELSEALHQVARDEEAQEKKENNEDLV